MIMHNGLILFVRLVLIEKGNWTIQLFEYEFTQVKDVTQPLCISFISDSFLNAKLDLTHCYLN